MKTKGFTLVELMIVVAIIGILASVAIPGFMKYIKDSKTTEAKTNLKAIADGAVTYYQTEHANDTSGTNFTSKMFPYSNSCKSKPTGGTCVASGFAPSNILDTGSKTTINTNKEPWISLNFQVSAPVYYSYGYYGFAGMLFIAQAAAKLDSKSKVDSCFRIVGESEELVKDLKIHGILDRSELTTPCANTTSSLFKM